MSYATGGTSSPQTGSDGSTVDKAKGEVSQVGQTAKEATSQVATTAADQARNVAGETRRQAQDLIGQAGTQVQEQAATQKDKASEGLRSISGELRSLAVGTGTSNQMINDLTQQAADKAQEFADWLEQRDPGALVEEIRDLARRKPGTFLIGAVLAGVIAGRMTRGIIADKTDSDNSGADANAWASTTAPTGISGTTFDDGTSAFATSEPVYTTETPSVTMPGSDVRQSEWATAGSDSGRESAR